MTVEMLSILAGSLLALLFAYLPGLSEWYQKLGNERLGAERLGSEPDGGTLKRLVMLACLALTAGVSFGLACSGWEVYFGLSLSCTQGGAAELLRAFILALIANQSTHRISPRLTRSDSAPSSR